MPFITTRHYYDNPIPAPEPEKEPQRRKCKAEIARINGAKSKGPKTPEGKAKSRLNSVKHGLTSKLFVLESKDEKAFDTLKNGLLQSLKPQDPVEQLLVQTIAQVAWKLRQADHLETDLLRDNLEHGESAHEAFSFDADRLMLLSTYQLRLDRRLHRLFEQFRKLQMDAADPKRNPVSLRTIPHPMRERPENAAQEKYASEPTDLNLEQA